MAILYKIAGPDDLSCFMESRKNTLRLNDDLPDDYTFDADFLSRTETMFLEGEQDTVLAFDNGCAVGSATVCYFRTLPLLSLPHGTKGYVTNVYTDPAYQGEGIASDMMIRLIEAAKARGIDTLTLEATEEGKPLYEKLGFTDDIPNDYMTLDLNAGDDSR